MKLTRREILSMWAGAGLGLAAGGIMGSARGAGHPAGPVGLAICIGLNVVNPQKYIGWKIDPLGGCLKDVETMTFLAHYYGYQVRQLKADQATTQNVKHWIQRAADGLVEGDILLISYSGHGAQVTDTNGDERNADRKDETWCLYDGQLIDDELAFLWSKFRKGVRILVVSDSCNSGTMLRVVEIQAAQKGIIVATNDHSVLAQEFAEAIGLKVDAKDLPGAASKAIENEIKKLPAQIQASATDVIQSATTFINRAMPDKLQKEMDKQFADLYRSIQSEVPSRERSIETTKASVMLLSGCQDGRSALDLGYNGLFTAVLREIWNQGKFTGTHNALRAEIAHRIDSYGIPQYPNYMVIGEPSKAFEIQPAFKIKI